MNDHAGIGSIGLYTNLDRIASGLAGLGIERHTRAGAQDDRAVGKPDRSLGHEVARDRHSAAGLVLDQPGEPAARHHSRHRPDRGHRAGAAARGARDRRRSHAAMRPRGARHASLRRRLELRAPRRGLRRRGELACGSAHSRPAPPPGASRQSLAPRRRLRHRGFLHARAVRGAGPPGFARDRLRDHRHERRGLRRRSGNRRLRRHYGRGHDRALVALRDPAAQGLARKPRGLRAGARRGRLRRAGEVLRGGRTALRKRQPRWRSRRGPCTK